MATTALHVCVQVQHLWLAQRSFLFLKVVYDYRLHFPLRHFHASEQLVILCTSFASQMQRALGRT
jgi:hypothetical protein